MLITLKLQRIKDKENLERIPGLWRRINENYRELLLRN
jgi:hypothetical protein